MSSELRYLYRVPDGATVASANDLVTTNACAVMVVSVPRWRRPHGQPYILKIRALTQPEATDIDLKSRFVDTGVSDQVLQKTFDYNWRTLMAGVVDPPLSEADAKAIVKSVNGTLIEQLVRAIRVDLAYIDAAAIIEAAHAENGLTPSDTDPDGDGTRRAIDDDAADDADDGA